MGFPLDLTQDALRARGLSVDTDGFNAAMERQRADARRAWSGSGEAATETIWYALRERVGATEFLGYETETAEGVIGAIVKDGVEVESATSGRARIADPQSDAVLRRIRRPGRRRRRDHRVRLSRRSHGHAQEARRPCRPRRDDRRGRGELRSGGRAQGRSRRAHGDARQPFGDPHPA